MLVSSCGVEDSLRELSALSKDPYESSPGGCRGCSILGEPEQPDCVISSYLQESAPVKVRGPSTARTDSKRIGLAPLRMALMLRVARTGSALALTGISGQNHGP